MLLKKGLIDIIKKIASIIKFPNPTPSNKNVDKKNTKNLTNSKSDLKKLNSKI